MSRSALVFLLLGVSCGVWAEKGYETIGRLQKTLMTDYNKWVIPLVDLADRVKVAVGFNVIAFEMNDKEDALSANTYFDISWKDKRLTWSPEEYGGVKQLHLPGSMLWRPDITPYNNVDMDRDISKHTPVLVIVKPCGKVIFIPPVQFKMPCRANVFDESDSSKQVTCTFQVGSWTHSSQQFELVASKNATSAEVWGSKQQNGWEWVSSSMNIEDKTYSCCAESYPLAELTVNLRKQ